MLRKLCFDLFMHADIKHNFHGFLKALANKGALLPVFLGLRKLGNICCRQNVSEQNQKQFLGP